MSFRNRMRHPGILFNTPDGGTGGGGGGGGTGGTAADAGARERVEATVQRLMAEGRAQERLVELHLDNHNLRERVRQMEGRQEVPQGGLVLNAEDAAAWAIFKGLGKAEDVKKAVEKVPALEGKLAEREFRDLAAEAAGLVGYEPTVLADLITSKGLELKLEDVKVADPKGGAPTVTKVPHVRPKGQDGAAFQPLADYATANLAAYLPALTVKGGANGGKGGSGSGAAATGGVPFPVQNGSGTPAKQPGGLVDEFMEARNQRAAKAPNPLAKRPATTAST